MGNDVDQCQVASADQVWLDKNEEKWFKISCKKSDLHGTTSSLDSISVVVVMNAALLIFVLSFITKVNSGWAQLHCAAFWPQSHKHSSIVPPGCIKSIIQAHQYFPTCRQHHDQQPCFWSAFYNVCFEKSAGFFAMAAALAAFLPSIPPFPRFTQPTTFSGTSAPRARWNGTWQVEQATGCRWKTMEGTEDGTFLAVVSWTYKKKR